MGAKMTAFRASRSVLVILAVTALATPMLTSSGQATPQVAADPVVIGHWHAIATRTIFVDGLKPPPVAQLYLGFVSVAMYNAVVTIEGRFEPYAEQPRAHAHASPEAAAATAAYRVLRFFFPASAAKLDADYAASLALIPQGVGKVHGIRVGEAAAAAIVRLRQGDGRDDLSVVLEPGLDPGEWRPTPPTFLPMLAPWLGFVRPLLLESPTQIPLAGPDAISSDEYAKELDEVKELGARDSATRTPAQTETARFWSDNLVRQYQESFILLAEDEELDIVESARMFAVLNTTGADAEIACWRGKYDFAYWRPITAIRATVDSWTPLLDTPPYPEYPSGHACLAGATANGLSYLFGSQFVDLEVKSLVTGTTRHYLTEDSLNEETMDARVWLGIHFRKAMVDANKLGHDVSAWALSRYFQPVE
jgi:hypothetical protein